MNFTAFSFHNFYPSWISNVENMLVNWLTDGQNYGNQDRINITYWLVVEPPLWKICSSVGDYYSQHMESHKSHVPNHQPVISWSFRYFKWLDFDRCSRYPPWRQTVAAPKACYFPCVFRVCSWYLIIFVMNFPTYLLKCFLALSLSLSLDVLQI